MEALVAALVVAGLSLTIAAFGGALAQGNATGKAAEGIARQPEASGKIQVLLILGLAFIESLVLYVLLISMLTIFLFAKPLLDMALKG